MQKMLLMIMLGKKYICNISDKIFLFSSHVLLLVSVSDKLYSRMPVKLTQKYARVGLVTFKPFRYFEFNKWNRIEI